MEKGWCPNFPFLLGEMCDELVKTRRDVWKVSKNQFHLPIDTKMNFISPLLPFILATGIVLVFGNGAAFASLLFSLLAGGVLVVPLLLVSFVSLFLACCLFLFGALAVRFWLGRNIFAHYRWRFEPFIQ